VPANIVIDLRMISSSGIGTYCRNVVPRVMALCPEYHYLLIGQQKELAGVGIFPSERVAIRESHARIFSPQEQMALFKPSRFGQPLFWATQFNIPFFSSGRLLVTIYDVMHLAQPHLAGGRHKVAVIRFFLWMTKLRAASIITISEFTRQEIIKYTGIRGELINAIHLGVDQFWSSVDGPSPPRARPYFLFVGNVKPHKNIAGLLRAFEQLMPVLDHELLIVGRREGFVTGDAQVGALAERLGPLVSFTGYISDSELRQLIAGATALVLPSFYEGFGLPPLEAMAVGCPTIVSQVASLPEVCGTASLYCDPLDPQSIARQMARVAKEPGLREQIVAAGKAHAAKFQWEATARAHVKILQKLADGSKSGCG
jgi:glycosyltransferase involved in cell wall biosynthesis